LCILNCTSLLNSSAVFISNSTCQACPTGCLTCSNSSYCSSCASPYFFDLNRCVLNCSLVRNASYLLNGSCLSCNSTCTDCLNNSYCTGCSQNATFLSNGQCLSCGANCQSCLNASQCTSCDSAFFIDGGFCLPNCSTISNSTYLRNRTCERCPIGCASCNNQSYCTTCNNNYTLSGNNTCVPDCSLIGNCSACTVLSSTKIYCSLCSQGYSASSGVCKPSCGDGYYIGAEEGCDDGNSENGDGCSS
jgi:proprotein convertase subtilisin/kexin type 5